MRRYIRAIEAAILFVGLAVLPGVAGPEAQCLVVRTDYHGWKGTRLSNQWISLVLVPQLGGRLMQVSFGGHEYLFVNTRYYGQYFPSHAIMKNIAGHPIRWAVQSVTQYDTGDTHDRSNYNRDFWAFTAVRAASAFGRQFDVHAGPVDHPSYSVRDKRLFALHWSYLEGEVGIDSLAGWVAVVDGSSNYAMVERFSVDPKAEYPDGASVIFYLNGPTLRLNDKGKPEITSTRIEETPYYMEAELNSPLVTLLPGNTYAFDSEWLPTRGSPEFFDVTDAGLVGTPLLAKRVLGGVRMRGDFGVFFPGHLVANCYNLRGVYLYPYPLANVSPLEPASLKSTIGASVECARVSVHLVGAGGLDRGSLGEAYVSEPKTP
jgi:hypothetical protein